MEGRRAYNNESRRIKKANGAWENKEAQAMRGRRRTREASSVVDGAREQPGRWTSEGEEGHRAADSTVQGEMASRPGV